MPADWPPRRPRAAGAVAAHYWQAFACLVPSRLRFPRRLHREATDAVNKVLNYGYALLLNRVWVAVHRAGLEPTLGLLPAGLSRMAPAACCQTSRLTSRSWPAAAVSAARRPAR